MTLKFANRCGSCGEELPIGEKAWGIKSTFAGSRWHFECKKCRQDHEKNHQGG